MDTAFGEMWESNIPATPIPLHIPAVRFQSPIPHPIPLSALVILSHTSFARRLFFQTIKPCGKTHLTKSFCGYLDNLGAKAFVSPNGLCIEGGVHRGDLFVDDGSVYDMSITTEWQNAPKGDEGNWIKIRIN